MKELTPIKSHLDDRLEPAFMSDDEDENSVDNHSDSVDVFGADRSDSASNDTRAPPPIESDSAQPAS